MLDEKIRIRRKEYMKNYYYKRKHVLHYLINSAESLVLCIFKKAAPNF